MNLNLLNNRGESILETIIALTIISSVITYVALSTGSSLQTVTQSKNRLIAINLSRQGIESFRNIRDSNWLQFSARRRQCWNHFPQKNINSICEGNDAIAPGNYLIYQQKDTNRWRLMFLDDPAIPDYDIPPTSASNGDFYRNLSSQKVFVFDQNGWRDVSRLSFMDLDLNIDLDQDGDSSNDSQVYNHALLKDDLPFGSPSRLSPFYRTLEVEYITNNGDIINASNWPSSKFEQDQLNRMRITSVVSWEQKGKRFDVELTTHLTDYLNRTELKN